MGYVWLAGAIISELIATTLLKCTDGFSKLVPSIGCVLMYVLCYYFLSKALTYVNLGIAYAIWCGVGIVAMAVISSIVFGEKLGVAGIIGIILIMTGSVVLNLK